MGGVGVGVRGDVGVAAVLLELDYGLLVERERERGVPLARARGRMSSRRNDRAVGSGRTCVSLWMVGVKSKGVMTGAFVGIMWGCWG